MEADDVSHPGKNSIRELVFELPLQLLSRIGQGELFKDALRSSFFIGQAFPPFECLSDQRDADLLQREWVHVTKSRMSTAPTVNKSFGVTGNQER
jgi:hypothetical protein